MLDQLPWCRVIGGRSGLPEEISHPSYRLLICRILGLPLLFVKLPDKCVIGVHLFKRSDKLLGHRVGSAGRSASIASTHAPLHHFRQRLNKKTP
jgi:hypothetical protein